MNQPASEKEYPDPNKHEHTNSLYVHCLICHTFGIDFPTEFVKAAQCGNCKSMETVKYYPSCCMVDAFNHGKTDEVWATLNVSKESLANVENLFNEPGAFVKAALESGKNNNLYYEIDILKNENALLKQEIEDFKKGVQNFKCFKCGDYSSPFRPVHILEDMKQLEQKLEIAEIFIRQLSYLGDNGSPYTEQQAKNLQANISNWAWNEFKNIFGKDP